jgi:hypothetical protein
VVGGRALTGLFGYQGHTYSVMNMGSGLHAMLEFDPNKMLADHPKMNTAEG